MIFATSERLILRRPEPDDQATFVRNWSDPEMTRFTGARQNIDGFVAGLIADMAAKAPGDDDPGGPWYQYAVARRDDGTVIGDVGVGFGVPGERQAEIGYRIHPDHQRRGYAKEAVQTIVGHLFESHGIHRIVGVAAAPNAASIALLRSLDFRQEGHFRESFLCNGEWLDDAYFALLASEWRARKTA